MLSQRAQHRQVSTTLVDQPVAVRAALQVMAKGSLNAVTRRTRIEYAKDGIRVNTVRWAHHIRCKTRDQSFSRVAPVGRMGEIQKS